MDDETEDPPKDKPDGMYAEARERFDTALDDDTGNRDNHAKAYRFAYTPGAQWDDDLRARRAMWKEPCLEYNQLTQFVHQVVNDQRQNRPGIRVHPAGGKASDEVAKIIQGMVRGIEYASTGEAVYDTGYESSVVGGRGWWRLCTEYEPMSFDQSIKIVAIKDALRVVAACDYIEPDGGDRKFVFVSEKMSKEEFLRQWPKHEPVSWTSDDKGDDDDIVIVDYYRRVATKRTLVMMSDRAIGWLDEMPQVPEGVVEVARRESDHFTVEWYKLAGGDQVLEKYDCPGECIPVVCTVGDDLIIDGKRLFLGLLSGAMDAQRMLNYGMTQQALHLAYSPRPPWLAAAGQLDQYKDMWANANNEARAYLVYTPVSIEGIAVPPPKRDPGSSPDAGWLNWTDQQRGMIKSTIGMYENSLGQRANESSGRAILAREKQGDNATFHFADNLSRAIALTGKIIISWIPHYYDTQRIVHIVGLDGVRESVVINQDSVGEPDPQTGALQAIKLNDVSAGKYAVTVEAGPSYATKRQESAQTLTDMVRAFPPIMQVAGDIVMRAQEIPDAEALAERLKMTLPPQVQQMIAAKEKGGKPPDPQVMQAMAQKDQQLQQAKQVLSEMQNKLREAESGAQEKIAIAQIEGKLKQQAQSQDAEAAMSKTIRDAQAAVQKAEIEAEVQIEKAHIQQRTDIAEAQIAQRTALLIASQKVPEEQGELS